MIRLWVFLAHCCRRGRSLVLPARARAAMCYMRTLTNIQAAVLLMLRGTDAPAYPV